MIPTIFLLVPNGVFIYKGMLRQTALHFQLNLLSPNSGEAISLNDNGLFNLQWSGIDPENDNLIYILYLDTTDGFQAPNENIQILLLLIYCYPSE